MASGAVDLVIGGWIPSPDVEAAFSKSYLETGLCLVVRKGSAVERLRDLRGKKVGIYADPTVEAWARRVLAESDVRPLSDGYFKLLVGEDLDAVVYDYPYAIAEMTPYAEELRVAQLNLSAIRYTVLVPLGNDALLAEVNAYIADLRASGTYRDLLAEFLSTQATTPPGDLAGTIHTASGDPDSLSAVATAVYGDASKWKVLWKANKGHIAFPELVPKGTPVVVP